VAEHDVAATAGVAQGRAAADQEETEEEAGVPVRLVAGGPGLGDSLAILALVHSVRAARPHEAIEVVVAYPEVWIDNPYGVRVVPFVPYVHGTQRTFAALDGQGMRLVQGHIIQWMCEQVGVPPPAIRGIRPYLTLRQAEQVRPDLPATYVTISADTAGWCQNRDWPFDRWAKLARRLREAGLVTVQLRAEGGAVLPCDADYRGKSVRAVANIMAHATMNVSSASGPMWLAASVGAPATIVWPGTDGPVALAPPFHRVVNYLPPMHCAPCYKNTENCPYGTMVDFTLRKPCLDGVSVEDVATAVLEGMDHGLRAAHAM